MDILSSLRHQGRDLRGLLLQCTGVQAHNTYIRYIFIPYKFPERRENFRLIFWVCSVCSASQCSGSGSALQNLQEDVTGGNSLKTLETFLLELEIYL